MSVFTLDHVVGELVHERTNPSSQNRAPRGSDFYYDSWESLNRWLESRLKNRLGGTVTPLGTFTWEFKDAEDGKRMCRPIFLLADSFRKDHHIRGNKFHPPTVAASEEANYSLMAIKFSKSLTKDMLFAGVREMIKKIGDYVDRIIEIEIEFSFGVLRCKERRVTFEFDNARLRQILPRAMAEELEEKELGYSQNASSFNKDYHSGEEKSNVDLSLTNVLDTAEPKNKNNNNEKYDTSTLPPLDLSRQSFQQEEKREIESPSSLNTGDRSPVTVDGAEEKKKPFRMPKLLYNGTYKDLDSNSPQRPVSPGLQRILESYDKDMLSHDARVARRLKACEDVAQQAFHRCLNRIENETAINDYIDYQDRMIQNDWEDYSMHQRQKEKEQKDIIFQTMQQQMKDENDRRKADKLERKMTQIPLGLPGQKVLPEESKEAARKRKQEMRAELRQMIEREKEAKATLKQTHDREERDRIDALRKEVDLDTIVERKNKLCKQRDLLDAWEREAHIRNLQKIQKKRGNLDNIQSYINSTQLRGLNSARSSGSDSFRMGSVGFDPRKK